MAILITLLHIMVCLFLIAVILLQSGKAGDIASAFGGMGSQTAFGPRGAQTALGKATIVCAVLFMLTSITLAILSAGAKPNASSILGAATPATATRPTAPKPPAK
ncbi:MAG TPA: preprotein translocase subunit SecG [Terriglobales bacterium]|nr:preprotein translocase subunit SecG [Terriglobales bacterium]